MALRKCPKCELNYIKGDAPYCDVCMSEMKRTACSKAPAEEDAEPLLCSECGEAPAVPGYELCTECLKEQKRQQELEDAQDLTLDGLAADEAEEEEEE